MAKTRINDIQMAYEDRGQGMPLLLLHGAWLSQKMWQPQIAAFSDDFRVISCDLRGHGESDRTDAPYSIELLGEDVIQLMNVLNIERFVGCGHSLGGMVAQYLAVKHPDRLIGLVLADTSFGTTTTSLERLGTQFARWMMQMSLNMVIRLSIQQYGNQSSATRSLLDQEMGYHRQNKANALRIMDAVFGFEGKNHLAQITLPTLIVVGEKNPQTHAQNRLIHTVIRESAFYSIPGASHLLNMDNTVDFNQLLRNFLLKLSPSSV